MGLLHTHVHVLLKNVERKAVFSALPIVHITQFILKCLDYGNKNYVIRQHISKLTV